MAIVKTVKHKQSNKIRAGVIGGGVGGTQDVLPDRLVGKISTLASGFGRCRIRLSRASTLFVSCSQSEGVATGRCSIHRSTIEERKLVSGFSVGEGKGGGNPFEGSLPEEDRFRLTPGGRIRSVISCRNRIILRKYESARNASYANCWFIDTCRVFVWNSHPYLHPEKKYMDAEP